MPSRSVVFVAAPAALAGLTAVVLLAGCRGAAPSEVPAAPAASQPAQGTDVNRALREITDQAGRKVMIPRNIETIYPAQPYTSVLLYVVAPDLSLGVHPGCWSLRPEDRRFISSQAAHLAEFALQPSGSASPQINVEAVLRLGPDFALAMGGPDPTGAGKVEQMGEVGTPVVYADIDTIEEYPAGLEFLAKLVGREERGKQLSEFATRMLTKVEEMVAAIPEDRRVRVYYAESDDGLATEPARSHHCDALRKAGASLVHQGDLEAHYGMEKISMEQVLRYDPEVIVAQIPDFALRAYTDARWQGVQAVASRRVLTVPRTPFNWIDRPPSVMRIAGVPWLAYRFYPDKYPGDIREDLREFHRLFMGVEVTDEDMDEWLN